MIPDVDDDRPWRWRCGITSLCGYCGPHKAALARRALQAAYLGTPYTRALITRTVIAQTILEGYEALVRARYAQNRSVAWRRDFVCGAGQIEIKRTRDDDGWIVHSHEQTLMRGTTLDHHEHASTWAQMVGEEGREGTFDAQIERADDRSDARRARSFRSNELLRDEEEAFGAGTAQRRRACGIRAHRPGSRQARQGSVSRAPTRRALRLTTGKGDAR